MAKQTIGNKEKGLSVRNKMNENFTEVYNALDSAGAIARYGGVFITNVTPQNVNDNVSSKVFSSGGNVLESFLTNTENITVSVLAKSGHTNYIPVVTVNGSPVTLTEISKFVFTGTINISVDFQNIVPIIVTHEDGASKEVTFTVDQVPQVLSATFTGGYPGTQTELKENDIYSLNVVSNMDIVEIAVDNFGAFKSRTAVASGTNNTLVGTIADRGTTAQLLGCRVRVKTSTGSWSEWFLSSSAGSTNGVNVVNLNNLKPSISFGTITYPLGQQAIKNSENATVSNTVTNFNTIEYTSPNSELSITSNTTYESSKAVTRIAGDYNVSTNNLRIRAVRTANNSETISNTVIFIAHSTPTISITTPSRMRSGGNDGTAAQSHTVTITANQRLIQAPSLTAPIGTWLGVGFSGSNTTWTRSLQIHDDMVKGTYDFTELNAVNLAGIVQTVIGSGASYVLGGFVSRVLTLPAFAYKVNMNVEASVYNKVTLSWSFNSSVTARAALNSEPIITNSWSLDALNINPTEVRILDGSYSSSSAPSTITIQEVV